MLKRCLVVLLALFYFPTVFAGFYLAPSALYERIAAHYVSFQGIAPRFALGYDSMFDGGFNVGFELYADYPFALLNNHRTQLVPLLRPKYSYGLSVLPGVALDDYVLGFLRLGGAATNFPDYDRTQKGFQVGAGLQYRLSAALTVRGEYDYVQYQVIDGIGQPKANQASVGLVYRFDCGSAQCDT